MSTVVKARTKMTTNQNEKPTHKSQVETIDYIATMSFELARLAEGQDLKILAGPLHQSYYTAGDAMVLMNMRPSQINYRAKRKLG